MDKRDVVILEMLMENGRVPVTDMTGSLGISETAVRKRIRKLEAIGAIKAYTTIVDPFFIDYSGVALVGIDSTAERVLVVLEALKKMDGIRYVALTSGDHMLMLEAWCRTARELNVLLGKIGKMKGVTRVCPAIFMKRMEAKD